VAPVLQKSSLLGRVQQVGVCKIRIEPFWILASKQVAGCTSGTCTTYARICLFGGSLALHTDRVSTNVNKIVTHVCVGYTQL